LAIAFAIVLACSSTPANFDRALAMRYSSTRAYPGSTREASQNRRVPP
jgi:hypothetical protein